MISFRSCRRGLTPFQIRSFRKYTLIPSGRHTTIQFFPFTFNSRSHHLTEGFSQSFEKLLKLSKLSRFNNSHLNVPTFRRKKKQPKKQRQHNLNVKYPYFRNQKTEVSSLEFSLCPRPSKRGDTGYLEQKVHVVNQEPHHQALPAVLCSAHWEAGYMSEPKEI